MRRYSLEIRQRDDVNHYTLPVGRPVMLGRAPDSDVVLVHPLVSGRHALIELSRRGPVIRDLGSKNGTWVNGNRLDQPRLLGDEDRISIGGAMLIMSVQEEPTHSRVSFVDEGNGGTQVFATIDTDASIFADDGFRAEAFRELKRANRNLAVIHQLGELLMTAKNEGELAGRILDLAFDVISAERGCVMLRTDAETLQIRSSRSRTRGEESMSVSESILKRTVDEGLSLLTADAVRDKRFAKQASIVLQGIRAAMCVPLRGRHEVLGAVYVDSRMRRGAFGDEDLELFTTLGILGGMALENLKLQRSNLKAERLAAIGAVVAGLSHDIRNILSALRNGSYLLDNLVKESEDADLKEAWEIMHHGTDTIGELVEDMVSYSKEREPDLAPSDLNALVERVAARYRETAARLGIDIEVTPDPDVGKVPFELRAIDRVLSNLVSNAIDAIGRDGGQIVVSTELLEDEVQLSVADDGCGIPPEDRERIFDLLYSTKGSKGTGFGLAVTQKIVEEHRGQVRVISEPEKGSTFLVTLPRG